MQAGPSIQLNRLELQGHSGCSLGGLLVELKNKETPGKPPHTRFRETFREKWHAWVRRRGFEWSPHEHQD